MHRWWWLFRTWTTISFGAHECVSWPFVHQLLALCLTCNLLRLRKSFGGRQRRHTATTINSILCECVYISVLISSTSLQLPAAATLPFSLIIYQSLTIFESDSFFFLERKAEDVGKLSRKRHHSFIEDAQPLHSSLVKIIIITIR